QKAKDLKVVDEFTLNIEEGVREVDLAVVATPVREIVPLIKKMLPHLKKGSLITDVGSVKAEIMIETDNLPLSEAYFVGGHPIAGTENSGVEAAFPELFQGKKCILTPTAKTNPEALEKIKNLWISVGSEVFFMDSQRHDEILAAVSHLPHMVAFSLVNFLAGINQSEKSIFEFSGGGLKDFTRIAGSHPVMWADIVLMNKTNLIKLLEGFQKELETFIQLVQNEDVEELIKNFQRSRKVRRELIK
ncbi:MAG: prephenate dehydrogenase/arogenate dehydrogenase family protein, partial [Desulfobacterota bacterium]|nr:prephenate dehydrogenase/arogenate dehydrogenase family protein [Thermodesulfobacteriota bacterium]